MPSVKFRRATRLAAAWLALLLAVPVPAPAQSPAAPGTFDYYVLALSWSPEHCASPAGATDRRECGTIRNGFVVHGLWPQFRAGGYPESCGPVGLVPQVVIARNLDVIPEEKLIRHEWATHGTCTGLDVESYLARVRAARQAVKLPDDYLAPNVEFRTDMARLRAAFAAANPGFPPEAFAAQCHGRHLAEVRICLGKTLEPLACGADVNADDCGRRQFAVRPLF